MPRGGYLFEKVQQYGREFRLSPCKQLSPPRFHRARTAIGFRLRCCCTQAGTLHTGSCGFATCRRVFNFVLTSFPPHIVEPFVSNTPCGLATPAVHSCGFLPRPFNHMGGLRRNFIVLTVIKWLPVITAKALAHFWDGVWGGPNGQRSTIRLKCAQPAKRCCCLSSRARTPVLCKDQQQSAVGIDTRQIAAANQGCSG